MDYFYILLFYVLIDFAHRITLNVFVVITPFVFLHREILDRRELLEKTVLQVCEASLEKEVYLVPR